MTIKPDPMGCHFCGQTITGGKIILDFADKSVVVCGECSRLKHDLTKPIGFIK